MVGGAAPVGAERRLPRSIFDQRKQGTLPRNSRPRAVARAAGVFQAISTSSMAKVRSRPASGWFASSVTSLSVTSATVTGIT